MQLGLATYLFCKHKYTVAVEFVYSVVVALVLLLMMFLILPLRHRNKSA